MVGARSSAPRRSRAGFYLVAAAVLIALALILWFLPVLAARSSLREKMSKQAIPWFRGTVTIGELSLGWLSPVRIGRVDIRDEHGQPLIGVDRIETARTLLSLLVNRKNLGEIQITRPVIYAQVRPGGSNLEDALAPFFQLPPSEESIACALNVSEGRCILRTEGIERETIIGETDAVIAVPGDSSQPISFELAAHVSDGAASGEWKCLGEWRSAASPGGVGSLQAETRDVPLAALSPVLARSGVQAETAGRLDGRCDVTLDETGGATLLVEKCIAKDLVLVAPQYLGEDRIRLARLETSGKISLSESLLRLEQVELACDAGKMEISGEAPKSAISTGPLLAALRETTFDAQGDVDLARLAQLVPQTLRLREGLTVTSGVVQFACATKGGDVDRRWEGSLETSNLVAQHEGRAITWDRPLAATFAIRDTQAGPVIDRLACESDFFRAAGRGSLAEGSLSLEGDLSKLAAELGRFVDLGEMQLGGIVHGECQWRGEGQDQLRADGQIRLTNFEWSLPGRRPWREPQLAIDFTAAGASDGKRIQRIDRAQLELASGGDAALVRLTAPVVDPTASTVWPLHGEVRGELASWAPRLENLMTLPQGALEGRFTLTATGAASKSQAHLESVALNVEPFYFQGAGLTIREPRVEAQGDFSWEEKTQTVRSTQATCASSTLAFRAENVSLNLPPSPPAASGKIDFRADLERLSQWRTSPGSPPAVQLAGMATGQIEARLAGSANTQPDAPGQTIQVRGTAEIENFSCSRSAPPAVASAATTPASATAMSTVIWQEPRLRLLCNAAYSSESDLIDAEQLSVAGECLSLTANGRITEATSICRVDLKGQHDYDLAKLLTRLRPWIGPDAKMTGRGPRPFTLVGPLFTTRGQESPSANSAATPSERGPKTTPDSVATDQHIPPELSGKTTIAWTSAAYSGIETAAGETTIELTNGVITLGPLDLPVSDGKLTLAPKLPLNASPLALWIELGPVLENVRISPEMCRTWLKYVAPLVADATQAEGRFSVALLQPARIPLSDPTRGEVRGVLNVHTGQIGPGPLSRQFLALADQIKAAVERKAPPRGESGSAVWLQLPEQAVAFEAAGGRVYHRDLTVAAKDVVIRTRGSVGLDQSLELLAEVPIQDRWVEREPLLAGFKGQSLQVPVSGSLTSPRLDNAGLEQLATQMLGGAARRLLEENLKAPPEIKNALDRLFRGQ
jgi:hypothetical protein